MNPPLITSEMTEGDIYLHFKRKIGQKRQVN